MWRGGAGRRGAEAGGRRGLGWVQAGLGLIAVCRRDLGGALGRASRTFEEQRSFSLPYGLDCWSDSVPVVAAARLKDSATNCTLASGVSAARASEVGIMRWCRFGRHAVPSCWDGLGLSAGWVYAAFFTSELAGDLGSATCIVRNFEGPQESLTRGWKSSTMKTKTRENTLGRESAYRSVDKPKVL